MKPFIDNYNAAADKYVKLLYALEEKLKVNKQIDEIIFDNITDAIAETVRTANLMMTEAKDYMDGDIDLARDSHSWYHDKDEDEPGSIIELSGRYLNILESRKYMMEMYEKHLVISREIYNTALDCHTKAVIDQTWWNISMPILIEENKKKPIDVAQGRHKKSKRRQRKPKKNKQNLSKYLLGQTINFFKKQFNIFRLRAIYRQIRSPPMSIVSVWIRDIRKNSWN